MQITFLRKRTAALRGAAALVIGLTGTIVVAAAPDVAFAAPTTTIAPTAGGRMSTMSLLTSSGCPATATAFLITVRGPSLPTDTITNGNTDLETINSSPGDTAAMRSPISKVWDQIRSDAGLSVINPGDYTWSFKCIDAFDPNNPKQVYTVTQTVTAAMSGSAVGAWTVGGGEPPTGTTTTNLSATPAGSAAPAANVTFTATVSPASVAGAVQFKDGTTALGAPVAVVSGVATYQTTALAAGTHSITAVFVPTDAVHNTGSTSAALPYEITTARLTLTTLTASPQSPAIPGAATTFTAAVTPATAVGSVVFKDGAATLGTVPVVNGAAAFATTSLAPGVHNIVAVFTPTTPTAFTSSQSAPQVYTVSTAQVTVTTLTASPVGGAAPGDTVVLTATVQPVTAAGSVQFKDGGTLLGTAVPLSAGIATYASTTLPVGTRSLTAVFVPTDAAAFAASTSAAQFYFIGTGARTTTVISTDPPGPVPPRTAVTLTAMVTPSSAAGTVQFFDGTTSLAAAIPVVRGTATFVAAALPLGTHPVSAVFTPTDTAVFKGSASTALSFVVSLDSPPVFTTPSKVNGNVVALGTASCDASITGADFGLAPAFVWIRDGAVIPGATDHVLQIPLSYYGHLLQCQVVVSNARGTSRSPIGAAVTVGAAGRVTVGVRPTLSGSFAAGHRLRVSRGTWSVTGATVTYQWMRDGRAIVGATRSSYVLTRADRGHRVTCILRVRLAGYESASYAPTARRIS